MFLNPDLLAKVDSETSLPFLYQIFTCIRYEAEAAIVNYYSVNSTLSGHTDHSGTHFHTNWAYKLYFRVAGS